MDRHGETYVATLGGDDGDLYCLWREGMARFEEGVPVLVAA